MTEDFELTKTEKTVYELLLQGYDTKEISEKLFISLPTSKAHRNSILKKTKTRSGGSTLRFSVMLIFRKKMMMNFGHLAPTILKMCILLWLETIQTVLYSI